MPTKEEVYDDQIAPLMTQIIALCKDHKIATVAAFHIGDDLMCTTALLADEYEPPDSFVQAIHVIKPPGRQPLSMKITTSDGSQELVTILD